MTDSSRPSLPPPSDADSSSGPSSAVPTSLDAAQSDIPEPFREAVSALREQTQTAAETIRALRAENQRLRDKVEELSQRPDVGDDDAFAHFDEDREALRQRIQHFIDAIDDHLDNAPESGVASGDIAPLSLQPEEESPQEELTAAESHGDTATDPVRDDTVRDDDSGDRVPDDGGQQDSISQNSVSPDETSTDETPEDGPSENNAPEERLYAEDAAGEGQPNGDPLETVQPGEPSSEERRREADPLADGLPDAAHFEVEVPEDLDLQAADSDASGPESAEAQDDADHPDSTPSDEPLLIAPGLSPRRSARRSARRGRRR